MDIFFTADTHYAHRGITRGESKWDDKSSCRGFDTVEDMNDAIIENINNLVKPGDHLYHLGDVAFGRGPKQIIEFRERIQCKNIFVFPGNHDYRLYKDVKMQSLFNKVRLKARMKINGQLIVMQHFPELIWDMHNHGAWMLHGHCHGSLRGPSIDDVYNSRKIMDVGMDAHPEFRPFHFDEVKEVMDLRGIHFIDHHR